MPDSTTDLLIIGAGPFGLAASARAIKHGLDHIVVGRPFSFWREHMPEGMCLRSDYNWHLDPENERTFERFLEVEGLEKKRPITLQRFLSYGRWFQRECGIQVRESLVERLHSDASAQRFEAQLDDGQTIASRSVLCAPGFWPFRNEPPELTDSVSKEDWIHSVGFSNSGRFKGRRCLIVGGRQSAFETAALLAEHGASAVTVVHRHPTPNFEKSDWSWVPNDLELAEKEPGWFTKHPPEQRSSIERHFWTEGRQRLEPWLAQRIERPDIHVKQNSLIESIAPLPAGGYRASLHGDEPSPIEFDNLILATGFKVDLARIDYLSQLLPSLDLTQGYPDLTPGFESTSLPGLYFVGLAAARQFGPYMGFLASCPFSARTAIDSVTSKRKHSAL